MRNAKIQIARLHSLKEFDFSYDPLYHILWEFRAGGHGNSSHNTTILVLQMPPKIDFGYGICELYRMLSFR